jgi:hypothetical protein
MTAPPLPIEDDPEAHKVAEMMIRAYGSAAPLFALSSIDLLLERGDFKTAAQWQRVFQAAEALLGA